MCCDHNRRVLHVQEKRRICGSSSTTLWDYKSAMGWYIPKIGASLGHVYNHGGTFGQLGKSRRPSTDKSCVKKNLFVFYGAYGRNEMTRHSNTRSTRLRNLDHFLL